MNKSFVNSKLSNCKLVVLDDDPTGIQTVKGCLLVTGWSEEQIRLGFNDEQPFFYILTNTRAMTREDAARVTREAMEMVVKVNREDTRRFVEMYGTFKELLDGKLPKVGSVEVFQMWQIVGDNFIFG